MRCEQRSGGDHDQLVVATRVHAARLGRLGNAWGHASQGSEKRNR
jgi:hypothetical protein